MANKQRREVEVTILGESLLLRPTFAALAELEDRLGMGLPYVAYQVSQQKMGMKFVPAVIYAGLVGAGNKKFTYEQIEEMCFEEGILKLAPVAISLLLGALTGTQSEEVEQKKK